MYVTVRPIAVLPSILHISPCRIQKQLCTLMNERNKLNNERRDQRITLLGKLIFRQP